MYLFMNFFTNGFRTELRKYVFYNIMHMSYLRSLPYRLDIYEPLNRTSPRIVRVAAASGLTQGFQIALRIERMLIRFQVIAV